MLLEFTGTIIFWRGPAPWYFVAIPQAQSDTIQAVSAIVTYGWGVIPVQARIGKTGWKTSLFPKDGRYLLPVKASVRRAEDLDKGDQVSVRLEVQFK